jgi:hypothetical protein
VHRLPLMHFPARSLARCAAFAGLALVLATVTAAPAGRSASPRGDIYRIRDVGVA